MRNKRNECWECKHRKLIPRNTHVECAKPDPDMQGYPIAIKKGWFHYPGCFDPIWKEVDCINFEQKGES